MIPGELRGKCTLKIVWKMMTLIPHSQIKTKNNAQRHKVGTFSDTFIEWLITKNQNRFIAQNCWFLRKYKGISISCCVISNEFFHEHELLGAEKIKAEVYIDLLPFGEKVKCFFEIKLEGNNLIHTTFELRHNCSIL